MSDYRAFLERKIPPDRGCGFEVDPAAINPALKPHTQAMVRWALAGGRRALFASFGLHKTCAQLEIMRLIGARGPCLRLIVLPLGVRQEFFRDARERFAGEHSIALKFIRRAEEIEDERTIYLTNYESVREGILDVAAIRPGAVSLDEAAILRGFGGTKTFRESMAVLAGDDQRLRGQRVVSEGVPLRFVATATPSPNEYIELLAYAAFLGVMDVGQAKTRFFKRNSEKADALTLHPHKSREFWLWVSSWALFVTKPSDICACSEKTSSGSDSDVSSSKPGNLDQSETAHGDADATAASPRSPRRTTSSRESSSVAGASDRSTAAKEHGSTRSGAASSIDARDPSTRTGPTTAAAASPSASDGANSRTSEPTWESRPREQQSTVSTTTGHTSRETADGQPASSKPATAASGERKQGRAGSACRCNEGYDLPPVEIVWHELPSDHREAGQEKDGQARLFRNAALGLTEASREKRHSLPARVAKLAEIVRDGDGTQWVIWCDLNDEQSAAEASLGVSCASLYGSQDLEEREELLDLWRKGQRAAFISKPTMYGAGINMQQAHQMAFVGVGYKFQDFIQAFHRIVRFGQKHPCTIHIIYTEAEREIKAELERKWRQHVEMVERMAALIREYGLSAASMASALHRQIGCERAEASGAGWQLVNNDCVEEARAIATDSVHLVVTSIPFSHQYEYSPSYNDFGHTDNNEHFWRQMDFLTPEIYRSLAPGRVCAVHVKDRITPGGINGFGFQTVTRISDACADHFERHGFAFLGRITVTTDVVRENNQTYRLGWSEQCKDGSRMGNGMPEYVMLFRKAPTDRSNGYADLPVEKDKALYTRPRWQFDAHGFWRSSGNRLLAAEDLDGLPQDAIFQLFRRHSLENVYDFEHDVALAEHVDRTGWLPSKFMLLQPASANPNVWTDIARMRTMNTLQSAAGKEMHVCPLQFDIVNRLIARFSMPGELVLDPFSGLGTVPYCAVKLRRRGLGVELNAAYHADAVWYLRRAEREASMPSLFDLDPVQEAA